MPYNGQFFMQPRVNQAEQRNNYQGQLDDLMRQLQYGQMQGKNPMQLAGIQNQIGNTQRDYGNWQQQQFAQGMSNLNRPGPPGVGSSSGAPSRAQMDPYLIQLLMSQLGMGGSRGPGGGGYGPQMGWVMPQFNNNPYENPQMGQDGMLTNLLGGSGPYVPPSPPGQIGLQNQTNQKNWWGGSQGQSQSSPQPTSGYGTYTPAPATPQTPSAPGNVPTNGTQPGASSPQAPNQQEAMKEQRRKALQGQMSMRQQELVALQGQLANLAPGSYQHNAKQSMINNIMTQLQQLQLQLGQLG
jgi:hypothetical protein